MLPGFMPVDALMAIESRALPCLAFPWILMERDLEELADSRASKGSMARWMQMMLNACSSSCSDVRQEAGSGDGLGDHGGGKICSSTYS